MESNKIEVTLEKENFKDFETLLFKLSVNEKFSIHEVVVKITDTDEVYNYKLYEIAPNEFVFITC